jgi:hypothetical protein
MRRLSLALAGLVVGGLPLVPAAAQASATGQAQAGRVTASVTTVVREFGLGGRSCAALRRALGNPSASCTGEETIHLTARQAGVAPDSGTYFEGYAGLCGGTPGGPCESWWVELHVQFTTSGSQAWVNGFSSSWCSAGGTPLTGCSYGGNGTSSLVMGATFTTNGYFYWVVSDGDGWIPTFEYPNWANTGGWCVGEGSACY